MSTDTSTSLIVKKICSLQVATTFIHAKSKRSFTNMKEFKRLRSSVFPIRIEGKLSKLLSFQNRMSSYLKKNWIASAANILLLIKCRGYTNFMMNFLKQLSVKFYVVNSLKLGMRHLTVRTHGVWINKSTILT